jgi:hypothetical protein
MKLHLPRDIYLLKSLAPEGNWPGRLLGAVDST